MRHHRLRVPALLAIGLTAGWIGSALAQDLSTQEFPTGFAPRCLTDELQAFAATDPCESPPAVFGLRGPTVVAMNAADVETTGSVSAPSAPTDANPEPAR